MPHNFPEALRLQHDPCSGVPYRLISAHEIRFSEIISAFSLSLDLTQGHPQGHCMRTALIGMRLARELKLPAADRSALFYALLLKDLGCSSNAARIAYLFDADDHQVKYATRLIDWTRPAECAVHCWNSCSPSSSLVRRVARFVSVLRLGPKQGQEISQIRCERGAEIARRLQLPESTAAAIYQLDEHWDGSGNPEGRKGDEISLLARICCLAQTLEVFFSAYGLPAALDVAFQRRGRWFDPQLVDALQTFAADESFWRLLEQSDLVNELVRWEPQDDILIADDTCLDRVAEAFAMVVDAKSPWTYQHSTRVARIALGIAQQFGCSRELERDIHRAALLHDLGKLGVSNAILDKPGKPTPEEFAQIRKHPAYTEQILEQVNAFKLLSRIAGGHHERLDGRGYHRGVSAEAIPWVTRVLTVADIYEALSAQRPYRDAMEWDQIREILRKDAGTGIDPECFRALELWRNQCELLPRIDAQLAALESVHAPVG